MAGSNRLRLRSSPWRHSAQLWQENSNFGLFQFKATCLPRRRFLVRLALPGCLLVSLCRASSCTVLFLFLFRFSSCRYNVETEKEREKDSSLPPGDCRRSAFFVSYQEKIVEFLLSLISAKHRSRNRRRTEWLPQEMQETLPRSWLIKFSQGEFTFTRLFLRVEIIKSNITCNSCLICTTKYYIFRLNLYTNEIWYNENVRRYLVDYLSATFNPPKHTC